VAPRRDLGERELFPEDPGAAGDRGIGAVDPGRPRGAEERGHAGLALVGDQAQVALGRAEDELGAAVPVQVAEVGEDQAVALVAGQGDRGRGAERRVLGGAEVGRDEELAAGAGREQVDLAVPVEVHQPGQVDPTDGRADGAPVDQDLLRALEDRAVGLRTVAPEEQQPAGADRQQVGAVVAVPVVQVDDRVGVPADGRAEVVDGFGGAVRAPVQEGLGQVEGVVAPVGEQQDLAPHRAGDQVQVLVPVPVDRGLPAEVHVVAQVEPQQLARCEPEALVLGGRHVEEEHRGVEDPAHEQVEPPVPVPVDDVHRRAVRDREGPAQGLGGARIRRPAPGAEARPVTGRELPGRRVEPVGREHVALARLPATGVRREGQIDLGRVVQPVERGLEAQAQLAGRLLVVGARRGGAVQQGLWYFGSMLALPVGEVPGRLGIEEDRLLAIVREAGPGAGEVAEAELDVGAVRGLLHPGRGAGEVVAQPHRLVLVEPPGGLAGRGAGGRRGPVVVREPLPLQRLDELAHVAEAAAGGPAEGGREQDREKAQQSPVHQVLLWPRGDPRRRQREAKKGKGTKAAQPIAKRSPQRV